MTRLPPTAKLYTTRGKTRGGCGHQHLSVEAAARCLDQDIRDCRRAGGYSDRQVVAFGRHLTEAEQDIVIRELNRGH